MELVSSGMGEGDQPSRVHLKLFLRALCMNFRTTLFARREMRPDAYPLQTFAFKTTEQTPQERPRKNKNNGATRIHRPSQKATGNHPAANAQLNADFMKLPHGKCGCESDGRPAVRASNASCIHRARVQASFSVVVQHVLYLPPSHLHIRYFRCVDAECTDDGFQKLVVAGTDTV